MELAHLGLCARVSSSLDRQILERIRIILSEDAIKRLACQVHGNLWLLWCRRIFRRTL